MPDLLPPNAAAAERALSEAGARVSNVPARIRDAWNPDTCPAPLLPWLADAFSVDQWNPAWSAEQKRAWIKASVSIHRRKGTRFAINEALASLSYAASVQEWFQYPAPRPAFTFALRLTITQAGVDQRGLFTLLEIVDRVKNVRSHLTAISIVIKTQAPRHHASVALLGSEITLSRYITPAAGLIANETTLII